ncbi:MAG TPA: type II toxin-antitoxin system RelE/ParE family toxin [Longimicrobiaceae bacterium]|nr:type II toxin-antitoxin system RelE/ParE family toxin [Longimicrobiaceae bacterium]
MGDPTQRFRVEFSSETSKELRKLGHAAAAEILAAIDKKLTVDPEAYGQPLRQDLKGYYKLAVGQWRVIYRVVNELVRVLILAVGKRAEGDHENIYDQISGDELDQRRTDLEKSLKKATEDD